MSDTPTETDLARDALQSEFNDLDVSGALVHAVEMFVEAKIREARRPDVGSLYMTASEATGIADTIARAILAEREACAKVAEGHPFKIKVMPADMPPRSAYIMGAKDYSESTASSIRNRTET